MKLLMALAAGLAACAMIYWYQTGRRQIVVAPAPPMAAAASAAPQPSQPGATAVTAPALAQTGRPRILKRPDGAERNTVFRVDPAGNLIVDEAVEQRLAALVARLPPQHSLTELERIEGTVTEGLAEPQASAALRLLHHYLLYSRAETWLLTRPRATEDVATAQDLFDRVVALRREHLGPAVADAFYAAEEARTRATLLALRAPTQAMGGRPSANP
ncbi:MAG: hypothetical protein KF796_12785 [Ramlibacter sp.]|nr:hypothetical protein [Ramlibacter sp.]